MTKTGLYDRFDEFHYQRTYTVAQYTEWLQQAGFEVLEVLADLEDEPLKGRNRTNFIYCSKKAISETSWVTARVDKSFLD